MKKEDIADVAFFTAKIRGGRGFLKLRRTLMKSEIDPSRIYVQVFEEREGSSELRFAYLIDGEAYDGTVAFRDGEEHCSFTKLKEDAAFTQHAIELTRSRSLRDEVDQRIKRYILSKDIQCA